MHLSHIQQSIIQNRNGHISVVNIVHVLWDMGQDTRVWILIYVCFNYIRRDCSDIYSFISKSISLINNFKAQTTFQIGHLSDTISNELWHKPIERAVQHGYWFRRLYSHQKFINPDSKVHEANMGPIWGRQDPGDPMVALWTLLSGKLHDEHFAYNIREAYIWTWMWYLKAGG